MNRVIVTGASGFIGNKIAHYFLQRGYDVIGWDRSELKDAFPIHIVDMLEEEQVIKQIASFLPDIIVHCAGLADVAKSVIYPTMDYNGNVTTTHNLLFSLHKIGLEKTRVVFLSSAGVYGNPVSLPIKEEMILNPLSPYAIHKVMCEELCKFFVSNYYMNIKVARIFSAYGAGLKKQIFWDMFNKGNKTGRLDMIGTGDESRDYIHVDDVAQALYLISTTNSTDIVFNVANGEEITIREVSQMFARLMGIKSDSVFFDGKVREGDPINWKADISRIQKLGYRKTVEMNHGLLEYIKWADEQG